MIRLFQSALFFMVHRPLVRLHERLLDWAEETD